MGRNPRFRGSIPKEMVVGLSLYDLASLALSRGEVHPLYKGALGGTSKETVRRPPETSHRGPKGHRSDTSTRGSGGILTLTVSPSPPTEIKELADWIYNNPAARCPGYRLAYDVRQELMNNLTEKISRNDIFDRAHVLAVPYVDAVTMDPIPPTFAAE